MTFTEYREALPVRLGSWAVPFIFCAGLAACVWATIVYTPHTPPRWMTPSQLRRWSAWIDRQQAQSVKDDIRRAIRQMRKSNSLVSSGAKETR